MLAGSFRLLSLAKAIASTRMALEAMQKPLRWPLGGGITGSLLVVLDGAESELQEYLAPPGRLLDARA